MPDAPTATTSAHDGAVGRLNSLTADEARQRFVGCCGSGRWAEAMCSARPYASADDLRERVERAFDVLQRADWLQAFAAHSRIGQARVGDATGSAEQAGAAGATEAQRTELAAANDRYEATFGHVFLIRAQGRSAAEMLAAVRERLAHSPEQELEIAAGQQREITRLRIANLLAPVTA